MWFLKKKSEQLEPGSDRVAARIAGRIIRWQVSLAARINSRVNRYSKTGQRKFLWFFCAAWIAIVCFNFLHGLKATTIHTVQPNYLPAHIGQPSDIPKPANRPMPQTDSLTIKK